MTRPRGLGGALVWDLLTFEKLMTNEVIHLIYWSGLGLIGIGVFGAIGAAVGVAIRDPFPLGLLMAIPVAVIGLLLMGALLLIWRAICEFYVAVFRISEDLRAMRQEEEPPRTPPAG